MYADDTVVFFSAPEVSAIQATLVRELQAIDFLASFKWYIYQPKTEAKLFGA